MKILNQGSLFPVLSSLLCFHDLLSWIFLCRSLFFIFCSLLTNGCRLDLAFPSSGSCIHIFLVVVICYSPSVFTWICCSLPVTVYFSSSIFPFVLVAPCSCPPVRFLYYLQYMLCLHFFNISLWLSFRHIIFDACILSPYASCITLVAILSSPVLLTYCQCSLFLVISFPLSISFNLLGTLNLFFAVSFSLTSCYHMGYSFYSSFYFCHSWLIAISSSLSF